MQSEHLERLPGGHHLRQGGHIPDVNLNNITQTQTGVRVYNVYMAAAMLTAIPPLVIYFISGKLFIRGITAGALKG
jgi:ABC-type glycerol-3-phosphate transport system permease component